MALIDLFNKQSQEPQNNAAFPQPAGQGGALSLWLKSLGQGAVHSTRDMGNAIRNNLAQGNVDNQIERIALDYYSSPEAQARGDTISDEMRANFQRRADNEVAMANYTAMQTQASKADMLQEQQALRDSYAHLPGWQQTGGNVATTIGRMVPSMVARAGAAAATGGASLVSDVLGTGAMFLSAAGNASNSALSEGASLEDAVRYGNLTGAVEAGTEKMFMGLPLMGGGIIDFSNVGGSGLAGILARRVLDAGGEGIEEVVSDFINPYLQRATYKPDAENATAGDLVSSFGMGGLVSLIMGAPGDVMNGAQTLAANRAQNNAQQNVQQQARQATQAIETAINDDGRIAGMVGIDDYMNRNRNQFVRRMSELFNIRQTQENRAEVRNAINAYINEMRETGNVTPETASNLFDAFYDTGHIESREMYDTYQTLKNQIRNTKLQVSETIRADIPDFNQFRKDNMGNINLSNEGLPVDVAYMELSEQAPKLFPSDIINPTDQLLKIAEVANNIRIIEQTYDDYYGAEAPVQREYAREQFMEALNPFNADIRRVRTMTQEAMQEHYANQGSDIEAINAAFASLEGLKRDYENMRAKVKLTNAEQSFLAQMMKGETTLEQAPEGLSRREIGRLYEVKAPYEAAKKIVNGQRGIVRQRNINLGIESTANSEAWQDKATGLQYDRETPERIFYDIIPDENEARQLIETYIVPIHENEANATRQFNDIADRVTELNLNDQDQYEVTFKYKEDGDPQTVIVNERGLVQMLGEGLITEEYLAQLGADVEKIKNAASVFSEIYNELATQMNNVYMNNGYASMLLRDNYFPHFEENHTDSVIGEIAKAFGIEPINKDALTTDITGRTQDFKPGRAFFSRAQQRKGYTTDFDAVMGLSMYMPAAMDVIHHTDDIQRIRGLETALRQKHGKDGSEARIQEILNSDKTDAEKMDAIQKIDPTKHTNLVQWLQEYGNILANKKSKYDRNVESALGRVMYDFMRKIEGRVGANMVAINPASWLTNFIPLTQALSQIDIPTMLQAMDDTMRNTKTNDGFEGQSTFLTNRLGRRTLTQTNLEKISNTMSKPFQMIDDFTSNVITRARFTQNIESGMSNIEAMKESDAWTASLMADRSKGALPTIFAARNPFMKAVTMFQVEVNNQLSFVLKDIPRSARDELKKSVTEQYLKMFIGAWVYNQIYELLTGRRAALDPIDIAYDAVHGIATGERPSQILGQLGTNILEETPFIGGLMGGGRLPISSALPNIPKVIGALSDATTGDASGAYAQQVLLQELIKPAAYILPPFGGGQLKKTLEGLSTVFNGGNYTVNRAGEEQLRFPVYQNQQTPLTAIQAALFGQYSLPSARDYVESGFRSLTPTQTGYYRESIAMGMNGDEIINWLNTQRTITADRDQNGNAISGSRKRKIIELLNSMNLSQEQWNLFYRAAGYKP